MGKKTSTNVRLFGRSLTRLASAAAYGLAPEWTDKTIRSLFFSPRPFPTRPHHQEWLDRGTPFRLDVLGRMLCGWEWGEGPPVILSHGWAARGIHLHRFIPPLVAAGFQVVAFDNPAHGESEGRHSNGLEFQKAFDAIRLRYPHAAAFVAHSMGSVGALRHAAETPLPVVLVSPLCRMREEVTRWAVQAGLARHVFTGIIRRLEAVHAMELDAISPHRLAPRIHAPVMILHDHQDRTAPLRQARELAACLPNGRLIETHGLGHNGILRTPVLIDRAVRFIVREHAAAGARSTEAAAPARRVIPAPAHI